MKLQRQRKQQAHKTSLLKPKHSWAFAKGQVCSHSLSSESARVTWTQDAAGPSSAKRAQGRHRRLRLRAVRWTPRANTRTRVRQGLGRRRPRKRRLSLLQGSLGAWLHTVKGKRISPGVSSQGKGMLYWLSCWERAFEKSNLSPAEWATQTSSNQVLWAMRILKAMGGELPELQQALGSSLRPSISGLRLSKCFSKVHLGLPSTTEACAPQTSCFTREATVMRSPPLTAIRETPVQQRRHDTAKNRYFLKKKK